jgi:hypothetical protein
MIRSGINAEGIIDIKSSILSGSLKSGNAGLFVCFFGFMLSCFSLLAGILPQSLSKETIKADRHRVKFALIVFFSLLGAAILCAIITAYTTGDAQGLFGFGAFFSGMAAFFWLFPLMTMIDDIKND